MQSPFFDRDALVIKPLGTRSHDLDLKVIQSLDTDSSISVDNRIMQTAEQISTAKSSCASVVMMLGGHVVRSGVQRYIIDLMERGYISCLSINGSVMIHDFELSFIGATTESVAKYIVKGQFGLWKETGQINDFINQGYKRGQGMGEAVGEAIYRSSFPFKDISLLAAGYRLGIPVTVHVGIGYDIIHEHPNCSGAATGETSYRDFLRYAKVLESLEGGVVMSFGSAVMAPEVFLKALSMVRNVAHQQGRSIRRFTTLVCDIRDLPRDVSAEPKKDDPAYYFRPWKTMLVRTVADGGKSFYVKGRHSEVIPALWAAVNRIENGSGER